MPELRQPGTGQPYQLDNLVDFTGGLNRSDDTSNVAGNQLIELTNMDPDPNGGVRQRRGVVDQNERLNASGLFPSTGVLTQGLSRMAYLGNFGSTSGEYLWGNSYTPTEGTTTGTSTLWLLGSSTLYSRAEVYTDMYVLGGFVVGVIADEGGGGTTNAARYWANASLTSIGLTLTAGVTDSNYESPSTAGHPRGRYACVQHNRAWVVSNSPGNRVWFSHPGTPLYWHPDDWVDIGSAGADIVGLYAIGDYVIVVKQDSVWAILGNTLEALRIEKILDAQLPYSSLFQERPHCMGAGRVWLWTVHNGLVAVSPNGATEVLSEQLRRNRLLPEITEISYAGNKVWCRAPADHGTYVYHVNLGCWSFYDYEVRSAVGIYEEDGAPADVTPSRVLALDPRRDLGIASVGNALGSATRDEFAPVEIDADLSYDYVTRPDAINTIAQRKIACAMRTGWLVGQLPTERKRWGRPRILVESYDSADIDVSVQVYKNYEESVAASATYSLDVSEDGDADIIRGPSGGRAEAISYRISTLNDTKYSDWGVAVIAPRFKPFRIKR